MPLPTYAFQRERYWLELPATTDDPTLLGQHPTGHPLLTAAISLPDDRGSAAHGPSVADSAPLARGSRRDRLTIVPGTALLELAVEGARRVGCEHVVELTLQAPLALAEVETAGNSGSVLSDPDEDGWAVAVHSRAAGEEPDEPWTLHARGRVAAGPGFR